MAELLIGVLPLLALGIFIVWESCAKVKPVSARKLRKGFLPGDAAADTAIVVMVVVSIVMGFTELVNPSLPPFTGATAFLSSILYATVGPIGAPILFFGVGAAGVYLVVARHRRRAMNHS